MTIKLWIAPSRRIEGRKQYTRHSHTFTDSSIIKKCLQICTAPSLEGRMQYRPVKIHAKIRYALPLQLKSKNIHGDKWFRKQTVESDGGRKAQQLRAFESRGAFCWNQFHGHWWHIKWWTNQSSYFMLAFAFLFI